MDVASVSTALGHWWGRATRGHRGPIADRTLADTSTRSTVRPFGDPLVALSTENIGGFDIYGSLAWPTLRRDRHRSSLRFARWSGSDHHRGGSSGITFPRRFWGTRSGCSGGQIPSL